MTRRSPRSSCMLLRCLRLHPGILAEKHEHKIDRIANSVRNDRHGQIASRAQINRSQQDSHQPFVDYAGYSLVSVSEPERDVDRKQAYDPRGSCAIEQVRNPVHEIAAVNHFLSERRQRPGPGEGDQSPLEISMQRAKNLKVGLLAQPLYQQWLSDRKLQPFEQRTGGNPQGDRGLPVPVDREADTAPAHLSDAE